MQAEAYPAYQRQVSDATRSCMPVRDVPALADLAPKRTPRCQLLGMVKGLGGRVKAATAFQLE